MSGLEGIKSINEGAALNKRARAYATNHPGVSVSEAVVILAGEDAIKRDRAKRAKKAAEVVSNHRRNRTGK